MRVEWEVAIFLFLIRRRLLDQELGGEGCSISRCCLWSGLFLIKQSARPD